MSELLKELDSVSKLITSVIETDDYYKTISPDYLRDAVLSYPFLGGKRLRPSLLLWTCGLFGGNLDNAVYAASAVEVYHNWTLVHDDIIDEDKIRRGNPTAHIKLSNDGFDKYRFALSKKNKFGIDFAILAGDLQNSWANAFLLKSAEKGIKQEVVLSLCMDLFVDTTRRLITGEALDVDFSYRPIEEITVPEVEQMIYSKTGVLLNFCVKAGAKIALNIADDNDQRISNIIKFSTDMGMAFQLKDDWLGIYGDESKFGKPIGSDISAAKPTLLVMHALNNALPEDKKYLLLLLGKNNLTVDEIKDVREIMTKTGAEKLVLDMIDSLYKSADKIISEFPDGKYKNLLKELNSYLVKREV